MSSQKDFQEFTHRYIQTVQDSIQYIRANPQVQQAVSIAQKFYSADGCPYLSIAQKFYYSSAAQKNYYSKLYKLAQQAVEQLDKYSDTYSALWEIYKQQNDHSALESSAHTSTDNNLIESDDQEFELSDDEIGILDSVLSIADESTLISEEKKLSLTSSLKKNKITKEDIKFWLEIIWPIFLFIMEICFPQELSLSTLQEPLSDIHAVLQEQTKIQQEALENDRELTNEIHDLNESIRRLDFFFQQKYNNTDYLPENTDGFRELPDNESHPNHPDCQEDQAHSSQ